MSSGDVPDEVQFRSDEGVKRNAYPLSNLGYVGQIANLLYALPQNIEKILERDVQVVISLCASRFTFRRFSPSRWRGCIHCRAPCV